MRYTILNRTGSTSLFKRALHEVILAPGDRLVLGYGYLYENVIKDIIDDERELPTEDEDSTFIRVFREWVNSKNKSEKEIIIIGNNEDDYSEYIRVAKYLDDTFFDDILLSSNLKIKVIIKDLNEWNNRQYHKKLAIKFTRDNNNEFKPIMALIGSSNFSTATYVDRDYSQEVDILLWDRYILEDNKKGIKNVRAKEREMLSRLEKNEDYMDKYEKILNLIDSVGIDFRLELQLEDVINEIENYNSCGFSLKYINENVYSDYDIDIEKLIDIINSSENENDILSEELRDKILNNCILCFYKYAQHNLDEENHRQYFRNQNNSFKRLIRDRTRDQIIQVIEDDESHYSYFKNNTFRNHINDKEVYEYLMEMLGVALNV